MKARSNPRIIGWALMTCGLGLVLPGISFAGDHPFSITVAGGTTVGQPGVVNDSGLVKTPLILNNFPNNGQNTTFGGPANSVTLAPVILNVKMCKPGTIDKKTGVALPEWLDQGNALVGVTGTLTDGPSGTITNNGYRMILSFSATPNPIQTCDTSNYGMLSYIPSATVTIQKGTGNNSSFNNVAGYVNVPWFIWNATLTAPEPGTLALMMAALVGLGWMSRKGLLSARRTST